MRVRWLVVVGLLWVAGCSDGVDNEVRPLTDVLEASVDSSSTSSVSSATSSSSTTAAPTTVVSTTAVSDEWAIPDNPDAAYFERVLNELERIATMEGQIVLDNRGPTPESEAIGATVSAGKSLQHGIDFWRTLDPDSETLDLLLLEDSPRASEVEILEFTTDCAVLSSVTTFDGVYRLPRSPFATTHLLRRAEPDGENLTGWKWYDTTVTGSTSFTCAA